MDTKLIHLSDLHLGKEATREVRFNRLIDYIRFYHPETPVCITGDITDHGTVKQFALARVCIEELAQTNPVFVVPGNHDYNFKGFMSFHSAGTEFKQWEEALGRPFGVGDRAPLPNFWMPCQEYPHEGYGRFQLDDYTQLFYVDSGDLERKAWCAQGWISEGMLKALACDLQKYQAWTRIVMLHHHPFNHAGLTKLKGANAFITMLNKYGCELLLFGHKHDGGVWYRDFPSLLKAHPQHVIPCISASHSSTEKVTGNSGAITVIRSHDIGTWAVSFEHSLELVRFP